jgi:hypothetical protein
MDAAVRTRYLAFVSMDRIRNASGDPPTRDRQEPLSLLGVFFRLRVDFCAPIRDQLIGQADAGSERSLPNRFASGAQGYFK